MKFKYSLQYTLIVLCMFVPTAVFAAPKKISVSPDQIVSTTLPGQKVIQCYSSDTGHVPGKLIQKKKKGQTVYFFKSSQFLYKKKLRTLKKRISNKKKFKKKKKRLFQKREQEEAACTTLDQEEIPAPNPTPTPTLPPTPTPEPEDPGTDSPTPTPTATSTPLPTLDPLSAFTGTFDTAAATHLYKRAGFGGTPDQIQAAVQNGLIATVNTLLTIQSEATLEAENQNILDTTKVDGRFSEWGTRLALMNWMLKTENQLCAKMFWFLHDTWTASYRSVDGQPHFLHEYRDIIKNRCFGSVKEMALLLTRSGMMLEYLNGRDNIVGSVNENYARELMELFALGIGNYTEADVNEVARALTGWTWYWNSSANRYDVHFVPARFDSGTKTFFAGTPYEQTGNLDEEDVINTLFDQHPAAPEYLAKNLLKFFITRTPTQSLINHYAAQIKANNYNLTETLRDILTSNAFFDLNNRNTFVKTPLEYSLGFIRNLEMEDQIDIQIVEYFYRVVGMGLEVLDPPSVKGWDDDEYWITSAWLHGREETVRDVLNRALVIDPDFDYTSFLPYPTIDAASFIDYMAERLGVPISTAFRNDLITYMNQVRYNEVNYPLTFPNAADDNHKKKIRGLIHLLIASNNGHLN